MHFFSIQYTGKKIMRFFANLFFPIECIECGIQNTLLCSSCREAIPSRLHTKRLPSKLVSHVAYGYTHHVIHKSLPRAKYYHSPVLFSDLTLHAIKTLQPIFSEKQGILVPVPLHYLRMQKRGFNQSEIICTALTENFPQWETIPLLKRTKHTPQQAKLKKHERIQNIKNAFLFEPQYSHIPQKTPIILVDDIISTGSTLMEMERILREQGFTDISAVGLARGGKAGVR